MIHLFEKLFILFREYIESIFILTQLEIIYTIWKFIKKKKLQI